MSNSIKDYINKICFNRFAEYYCPRCQIYYMFPLNRCIVKYDIHTTYPQKCDCGLTMTCINFKFILPILSKMDAYIKRRERGG